jgi:hypothetical protein
VLAYVFWHRPLDGVEAQTYERADIGFHQSLARVPPAGLRASAVFRVAELPWLAETSFTAAAGPGGYEDWFLLEDYAAMGVLNEAAVGSGHRAAHDEVAYSYGAGAGGLYGLIEGRGHTLEGDASAIWVSRPPAGLPGSQSRGLGEMLGDGMDPAHASLWRRQFVFGPAPEYCLLAPEPSAGVAPTRLPEGWRALAFEREPLWVSPPGEAQGA